MKKVIGVSFVLLLPAVVLAASGGGDHGHIPTKVIITQAINFTLTIGLLVFFTRKAVAKAFKERHDEFHAEVKKAESAKSHADKLKKEISERLRKLTSNQSDELEKAKSEAENIRKRILAEAEMISQKLKEDAVRTTKSEYLRAITGLRQDLLNRSVDMAQERMKDEVDGTDLKRLRGEFVSKIQVVR